MNDTIETQVKELDDSMNQFLLDAKKLTNKSAARRARKLSMEISRQMKQYRADSLK